MATKKKAAVKQAAKPLSPNQIKGLIKSDILPVMVGLCGDARIGLLHHPESGTTPNPQVINTNYEPNDLYFFWHYNNEQNPQTDRIILEGIGNNEPAFTLEYIIGNKEEFEMEFYIEWFTHFASNEHALINQFFVSLSGEETNGTLRKRLLDCVKVIAGDEQPLKESLQYQIMLLTQPEKKKAQAKKKPAPKTAGKNK